ncbi:MAG: energy transducer TonB [Candidatus Aureabacteria bacterium]|nr:energy transducer TonB [Candidatus Auribacterota bacterium]
MTRALSLNRIFFLVLAAHFLLLFFGLYSGGLLKPFDDFKPVTPVELIGMPAQPEAPAAPQAAEAPPAPEEVIPEERSAPKPKKITKIIDNKVVVPDSNLRKRLEERLSQVKTPALAARPGTGSGPARPFSSSWYTSFVSSRLYALWKQPSSAMAKIAGISALVSFRVYRDGHIEGISLKRSSGSDLMDQSTIQAVKTADPLPPLPGTFGGQFEDFDILFELTQ